MKKEEATIKELSKEEMIKTFGGSDQSYNNSSRLVWIINEKGNPVLIRA